MDIKDLEAVAKEHLTEVWLAYKAYCPEGEYLSLYCKDGHFYMNNDYWNNLPVVNIDFSVSSNRNRTNTAEQ